MLHKDNCKLIREAFEFLELVRLILEILRYVQFERNNSIRVAVAMVGGMAATNITEPDQ